jgi:hypothetical protein
MLSVPLQKGHMLNSIQTASEIENISTSRRTLGRMFFFQPLSWRKQINIYKTVRKLSDVSPKRFDPSAHKTLHGLQ